MLHIVNKSPYAKISLESCVRVANSGDPILLIEDAVLAASAGGSAAALVKDAQKNHEVYAVQADVQARGLDKLVDGVKVVDYAGFVDLVEKHKTMTWL